MNENAVTQRPAPDRAAQRVPILAGGTVGGLIPQSFDEVQRMAGALASAGDMVPKPFQGNPAAVITAIMRGAEIGLAPMQALSSIAVINGRATIWGDALPALMLRAGHHIDVEVDGAGDNMVATATLTRGDTGKVFVRRFSMSDAKRAGLAGKAGPWQQYPQRMVTRRAMSWACRDGAADALMGLGVSDEAADYGPDQARDVTPQAAAPRPGRSVYAQIPGSAAPTPPIDEIIEGASVEAASPDDDPEPELTDEQREELAAAQEDFFKDRAGD